MLLRNVVDQREQTLDVVVPPLVGRALRRHHDRGDVLAGRDQLRRSVLLDHREIGAALAGAVKEEDERPALILGGAVVALRQVEKVVERDLVRDPLLERDGGLVVRRQCAGR